MAQKNVREEKSLSFDKIGALASDKARKIHFIGIGGVSMYSLARLTMQKGARVSGSDRESGERTVEAAPKASGAGEPQAPF